MTLSQLALMKAWMVDHRWDAPMEYHTFDAVLTLWLMGWFGAPASFMLDAGWAVLACVALFFTPVAYCALRRRLHRRRRLRCDWLPLIEEGAGPRA